MNPHIPMQTHTENYLSERRRLGYGLRTTGYSVISFARYIDTLNSQEPLTVEIMADWARQDQGNTGNPSTWARRLKNLRSFCRYLKQFEPRTEAPDGSIFGRIGPRLAPHIYSEQELIDLLAAAHNLGSFIPGLRGATYETRFGLLRLTALRAFLKFAARRDVSSFFVIEQALGVPMKRFERPMLGFMSHEEMLAVIGQPGDTWTSQRDHLVLTMLYNTGARVSEIIGVKVGNVVLDESAVVHLRGKGRKQRSTPLWKSTIQAIRAWLRRNPMLGADAALLPNRDGYAMTRFNVTQRLNIAVVRSPDL